MPARVVVPALGGKVMTGEVTQIAGVGRDKFSRPEYSGKAGFADVVDFEVRVRLADTTGVDLRQGMAARVEIDLPDGGEVLRLPREAVVRDGDAWRVRLPNGDWRDIQGRPADPQWFAVDSGVAEGETVTIVRTRNR
jgi:multidrug efflux pump subunit AcrA (membrane-fusion protein)